MLQAAAVVGSAVAAWLLRRRQTAVLTEAAAIDRAISARCRPIPKGAFRVVTYNVLADGPRYAMSEWATYCVPKWRMVAGMRFPVVMQELKAYGASITALQEVQDPSMDTYFIPGHGSTPWTASGAHDAGSGGAAAVGAVSASGTSAAAASTSTPNAGPAPLSAASQWVHHVNQRLWPDELKAGVSRIQPLKKCVDASFYDSAVWQPLAQATVPFYSLLPRWLKAQGLTRNAPGVKAFAKRARGRYDGALLALLRHRASSRLLVVAQSHLYYHPAWPAVKALQGALLAQAAREFAESAGCAPPVGAPGGEDAAWAGRERAAFLVMGDLNSMPPRAQRGEHDVIPDQAAWEAAAAAEGPLATASGVYTLLTTGRLEAGHQEHPARRGVPGAPPMVSALGPLTSTMAVARGGAEPPLTTRCLSALGFFQGTLDYIFATPDLRVVGALPLPYETAGALQPPAEEGGAETVDAAWGPLPNAVWPSDHVALGVDLAFVE